MIQVFAGFDSREAIGYHTFCQSVLENASAPVSIAPLHSPLLARVYQAGQRDGSNAFTYSRFLIPYLMGYSGWAIFVDGSDMLCTGDIAELWAMRDALCAVQVVQHDYKTRHPVKYIGTPMEAANEDYPRKNWSSVMLINCGHFNWRSLAPESIATSSGAHLHRFEFISPRFLGELPAEWNWLTDEYGPNEEAKLLHWTAGMPGFEHYKNAMYANDWRRAKDRAMHAQNNSVVLSG